MVNRHAITVVHWGWRAVHQNAMHDAANTATAQLAMGDWWNGRVI